MSEPVDIMIFGTGAFAARIAFDLAATAEHPIKIVMVGRNVDRLNWLRVAGNARADLFGCPARFTTEEADLLIPGAAAAPLQKYVPKVLVQAASVQTSAVISGGNNAWNKFVQQGGLSATAIFQALISSRVASTLSNVHPDCHFINCCFPDVVNGIIAALDLPITCGIGNVAILSHAFGGELNNRSTEQLRVLAHYQTLGAWRQKAAVRTGIAPRVWIGQEEVEDVFATFSKVKLTPEPAIEISGASGVPLMRAMALGVDWQGHVPGPAGLPGGYPVRLTKNRLELDLPNGVSVEDAIVWNARFERVSGLVLDEQGNAVYTGALHDAFAAVSPELAKGFNVNDLESVYGEMSALRDRLQSREA